VPVEVVSRPVAAPRRAEVGVATRVLAEVRWRRREGRTAQLEGRQPREADQVARGRHPARGVQGREGERAFGLDLVDGEMAGAQPQSVVRCGLSAPAPLAHFRTAGARRSGIHSETDVLTYRARRHEPVCVGCRAPWSDRPQRTPH
jgi:hypothetical protein